MDCSNKKYLNGANCRYILNVTGIQTTLKGPLFVKCSTWTQRLVLTKSVIFPWFSLLLTCWCWSLPWGGPPQRPSWRPARCPPGPPATCVTPSRHWRRSAYLSASVSTPRWTRRVSAMTHCSCWWRQLCEICFPRPSSCLCPAKKNYTLVIPNKNGKDAKKLLTNKKKTKLF